MTDRPEVLFVCVHNAGRSQMAAALLDHHAKGAVVVRSAGSAPADQVNPAVVAAMAELGLDISKEFPKPLTDDAVQASDVVITMGCGDACPYYPGKRYLDWKLTDPAGHGIDAVRPIRDEIDGLVQGLLASVHHPRPVTTYDVVIVGSRAGRVTAAIDTARANLAPLALEGEPAISVRVSFCPGLAARRRPSHARAMTDGAARTGAHGALASIVPSSVRVAVARPGDVPDPLEPVERAAVAAAAERRVNEYELGRTCARRALVTLGAGPGIAIPSGSHREPVWPTGIVGSISHSATCLAAVVAFRYDVTAIGIDVEADAPLPDGVLDLIATPSERRWLGSMAGATAGPAWDRLLFSMKESIYKAWYPLTGRWLGFEDVRLDIDAASGCFRADLLVDGTLTGGGQLDHVDGRFTYAASGFSTAVTVP